MTTGLSKDLAGLSTSVDGCSIVFDAGTSVTGSDAGVASTGQILAARLPTGNTFQVTCQALSQLMLTVAPLGSQLRAGRALWIAVTGVADFMTAGMNSVAGLRAGRGFGPTRNGRKGDLSSTVAGEFVKGNVGTGKTVPAVADVFAPV